MLKTVQQVQARATARWYRQCFFFLREKNPSAKSQKSAHEKEKSIREKNEYKNQKKEHESKKVYVKTKNCA